MSVPSESINESNVLSSDQLHSLGDVINSLEMLKSALLELAGVMPDATMKLRSAGFSTHELNMTVDNLVLAATNLVNLYPAAE